MANQNSFGGTCFEVSRTPPDIQKKRQKEEARKCQEEIAVLTLVPFAEQPIVSFENIKLGQSSVRKLAIRNPSSKAIQVNLDKLPKKEKGFEFEYVDFILGPEEEAIVQIGWVPSNGTPLREVILAKFGKHHAQIKLIATCKAPMDKKKAFYPRPPLRMANPRVTQNRVGSNNKNEELKSSVPIPSNPITRQPNGTKPPWNGIGKENQGASGHDSDDLAPQTLKTNATNQNIRTTKQHGIVTNVEDYMSPVKDRTGYMNPLSSNAYSTPDRRQTFVKNAFVPMKSNEMKNMIALSQDILPSTPERRMTYVKNSIAPIKSQTPKILNSSQLPDDNEENECLALQETPISDQKIDTPCVDQKLVDTPLMNEAMKNNLNLSLEIAADCLLLTPDTSRARDYLSKCSKVDITQQVLKSSSYNVEQEQVDILSDVKERGSFTSLEKEEDQKDSSKDTYVVDEPTIASLDDITEEGSLHDTTDENKMDSLRLSPFCKLSDTNDDIAQTNRTEYSVPNKLNIVSQAHENISNTSEKLQNESNFIKELLPEVQEDQEKSLHAPTEKNGIESLQLSNFCGNNDRFITQTELSEYSTSNKLMSNHEDHDNISKISDKSEKSEFRSNNVPLPVTLEDRHKDETVDDISLLIANKVRLSRERNCNSLQPLMEGLVHVEDTFTRVQPEVSRSERELSVDLSLETIVNTDVGKDEVDQTIMETNQDVQRNSFLMDTVVEENFIPPNPGSSKYCSTAYKKDRTRVESQEFSTSAMPEKERSSEIVRTLFAKNSKTDVKAKVSLLDKMNENKPSQNEKELASETWVIPVGEENERKSEHTGNIRGNNIQPKCKPATNLKNRISLNPTICSRSTNKSINYSKMLTKSKPVNPRLTLIKPMKTRDTICHPNPHAAQNMYYDERWIEKQENGFKKWLNFVLTPPEGFDEADSQSELLRNGKLDVAKLWSACTKDVKVPRAPTREVLSLRAYTVQREMNRLRRNACTLLQSPDIANVLAKLEYEIEKHRFEMRKDKAIHKDVGMKKKFLMLILNYNPLWLRIGLETVFGRIIPMSEAADYVTISKFIIRDFLNNPDILSMFAHPTVPHHYSEGYEIKLKQFILKKFFNLVLFLDQAKKLKMIRHNPCLFNKDSQIKMSRDMITSFSRDFLAGEGDVIKHLGYLGFKVDHKQTHLDEFDFAVTNIAVDVRCGVRLCRLMEILTKNQKITESLRLPASTRMQKLHNVGVALKALEKSAAGPPPEKPTAKDVVDGHLQKTLDLLWHVIFGFQIGQLLSIDHLTNEIAYLEKTLNHEVRIGNENAKLGWNFYLDCKRRALKENNDNGYPKGWLGNERIMLLLKWAQLVCAHYGLEIENLSVSFSDGRGLCLLVHHYHPNFLPMEEICFETTQTQQGNSNGPKNMNGSFNDSFGQTMTYTYAKSSDYAGTFDKLLKNEKENFKLMHSKTKELGGIPILIKSDEMSNTIPDQKVTATFITYLAARLLDLSVEMKAARTIQLAWKRFMAIRREEKMKVEHEAARTIQKCVRKFMRKQKLLRFEKAAVTIQTAVRRYKTKYDERGIGKRKQLARTFAGERKSNEKPNIVDPASLLVQKYFMMHYSRKTYHNKRNSAILIQSQIRKRILRKWFLNLRITHNSANCIQNCWRVMKFIQTKRDKFQSIPILQAYFLCIKQRKRFRVISSATMMLQRFWRTWCTIGHKQSHLNSCVVIQRHIRVQQVQKLYHQRREAVIQLQSNVRKMIAKTNYSIICLRKKSAITIQMEWRLLRSVQLKKIRINFIFILQAHFRSLSVRRKIAIKRASVTQIQCFWRTCLLKKHFQIITRAISLLQKHLKQWCALRNYQVCKNALCTIQSHILAWMVQNTYSYVRRKNRAASFIQRTWLQEKATKIKKIKIYSISVLKANFKAFLIRKQFNCIKFSILVLQSMLRAKSMHKNYLVRLNALYILQHQIRLHQYQREYWLKTKAALALQLTMRFWLSKKNHDNYVLEHSSRNCATVIVQKTFRMYRAIQCKEFKFRCVNILQTHYRRFLERRRYKTLRCLVISLQCLWRRKNSKDYQKKNNSCIILQRQFKKKQTMKTYKNMIVAIVTIQSQIRRWLSNSRYSSFRVKINAAICTQKTWKTLKALRMKKTKLCCIVSILSQIRAYLTRLRFVELKTSTTKLQSFWRGFILAKEYFQQRWASWVLQSCVKSYLIHKRYIGINNAVITIQTNYRIRIVKRKLDDSLSEHLADISAIIVQSRWRKHRVRRRMNESQSTFQSISHQIMNENLKRALRNASEEEKLYYRTDLAIQYIMDVEEMRDMSYLIGKCKHLEFATRYSQTCCTRLIENNGMAMLILANLAERCNRSLPHMEVVSTICDIFINISELLETRNFVASWDRLDSILTIIFVLMNRFKENKKPFYIFSKCCSFLWKFCHQENVLLIFKTKNYADKLIAFEKNSKGTLNTLSKTTSGTSLPTHSNFRGRSSSVPSSAKKFTKSSHKKLAMRHGAAELSSNIVRFFDDYHTAITSLNKEVKRCSSILE